MTPPSKSSRILQHLQGSSRIVLRGRTRVVASEVVRSRRRRERKSTSTSLSWKTPNLRVPSHTLCILPLSYLWLIHKLLCTNQCNSIKGLLVHLYSHKCRKHLLCPSLGHWTVHRMDMFPWHCSATSSAAWLLFSACISPCLPFFHFFFCSYLSVTSLSHQDHFRWWWAHCL